MPSKPFIRIGEGHVIVVVGVGFVHVRLLTFPAFPTHHALRLTFFINEYDRVALAALGTLLAHIRMEGHRLQVLVSGHLSGGVHPSCGATHTDIHRCKMGTQ